MRLPGIAEARQGVALETWLAAPVLLEGVVTVQAIVVADGMTHVAGPLVNIDRGCSRTGPSSYRNTANSVDTRRAWNQRQ